MHRIGGYSHKERFHFIRGALERLREMIKGGVIYEITVGHSEIDEEDEGKEDKKKYSKWKKGRN